MFPLISSDPKTLHLYLLRALRAMYGKYGFPTFHLSSIRRKISIVTHPLSSELNMLDLSEMDEEVLGNAEE